MRFTLLLLAAGSLFAQPDVRQTSWGMTPEQVRAVEKAKLSKAAATALDYPTQDLLKTGILSYLFETAKLVRAAYVFASQHDDPGQFIADYQSVAAQLAAKHKKPTCQRVVWFDDSLQLERMPYLIQDRSIPSDLTPDDLNIGEALSLGHFQLIQIWQNPRTQIAHTMTGSKGRITHRVEYRSALAEPHPAIAACKQ